jgi:hypothetical protein
VKQVPLLARSLAADWADYCDCWNEADFPFEILSELSDGRAKGLSCYEVNSIRDLRLVKLAAALWLGTTGNSKKAYTFRFIHTDELDTASVSYEKTHGDLKIADLNSYHYEIKGLRGPSAVELAKIMSRGRARTIKNEEYLNEVAAYIRRGEYDGAQLQKDALNLLNKHGSISFRRKKKQRMSDT